MAQPDPESELRRLQKSLSKGLPRATVVAGASAFFRGEAMALLLAAVPRDAELVTVAGLAVPGRGLPAAGDAAEDDEAEAAGAPAACPDLEPLRGGGLFFNRAFVVVRRGDRWLRRHAPALLAALPKIAAGSGIVLEVQKLDRRTRLAKELTAHGAVFEFRDLYDSPYDRSRSPLEAELVQWVVARSRGLGTALAPEAAWLLVMQVGKDPARLCAELQRLREQLGAAAPPRPLGPEDLRGLLSTQFESTPFELADAVLGNDRARAFRSVRAMFDRGVKDRAGGTMDEGGIFPFVTSWLFQSLATVHEGRLLADAGVPVGDIPARLSIRGFLDRFQEQVAKNPRARLRAGLLALLHCQRLSRLTAEEPDVLLERFLAQWFDGTAVPAAREYEA
jgi:hypothetical protein